MRQCTSSTGRTVSSSVHVCHVTVMDMLRRGAPGDGKSSRGSSARQVRSRRGHCRAAACGQFGRSCRPGPLSQPGTDRRHAAAARSACAGPDSVAHVCALRGDPTPPPGAAGAAAAAGTHRLRRPDARHRQRLRVVSAPQEHVGDPRHRRWRGRARLSVGRRDQQRIAGSQYPQGDHEAGQVHRLCLGTRWRRARDVSHRALCDGARAGLAHQQGGASRLRSAARQHRHWGLDLWDQNRGATRSAHGRVLRVPVGPCVADLRERRGRRAPLRLLARAGRCSSLPATWPRAA